METTKSKAPVFSAKVDGNYGEFVLEPLERGFGVTLGNPLRRILLSSIPGTAVTSVYIEDVLHEFSTIPGVKEDVVQLILNLKELVVKFASPGSKTLTLRAQNPKDDSMVITAADLDVPSDAEIINPDQYLATLSKGGKLVMEIRVDEGVGYVPAERHGIKDRISSIPVDALYSPVRRVAFQVEDTRQGQRTDLDKLTLRIWTDGSVGPMEVLQEGVKVLRSQIAFFDQSPAMVKVEREKPAPPPVAPTPVTPVSPTAGGPSVTLDDLGLTTRVLHNLKEEGIESVESLLALSERELKKVPGIGERSLEEIKVQLAQHGYILKE